MMGFSNDVDNSGEAMVHFDFDKEMGYFGLHFGSRFALFFQRK